MTARKVCAGTIAALAGVLVLVPAPAPAASVPAVQVMVVGRGGAIFAPARTIAASAATVSVSGRSCSVAAATPLAVLADLRATGGPAFALRDYGHCGASTASAAELFVYTLGGERNRGQNGWEYKVGGAAGSTGAGDPTGSKGNGRLLYPGARVLWFWCEASAGGCERTLEVSAPNARRGRPLSATVYGYDNEGRGRPVAGATVSLGGRRATTAANGRATLLAPSTPGRYRVSATRAGMVPAFPVAVTVG
ncbi:MAG TPA: carboxypeptidase-like regulatory domain-containing protein [Solirubrobacteraceae bacterium]|nr:carboxypeptidase-like regulatory domain-containing protein [Solirubrobacteraceae bacterium]